MKGLTVKNLCLGMTMDGVRKTRREVAVNLCERVNTMGVKELDCVLLKNGKKGAIVAHYGEDKFCVEIVNANGETIELLDVLESDIEKITWIYK